MSADLGPVLAAPAPIGAVMLQTSDTAGPANYGFDHTEERYAVFLNGRT